MSRAELWLHTGFPLVSEPVCDGARPECYGSHPRRDVLGSRCLRTLVLGSTHRSCLLASPAGKSDEQRAAAALASVLCVQLGPGIESEEVLKTLGPILKKIICDGTASIQARQTVSLRDLHVLVWARPGRPASVTLGQREGV